MSLIEKSRFEAFPGWPQAMPFRQSPDLPSAHTSRLEQRQDACEIFGPAHAEGDHGKMVWAHHAKRNAFEVSSVRLFDRLLRQRTDTGTNWTGHPPT